ncbi:MAG: TonB-dependent receptor plug domain-containing protein [Bacteroidota bacterium]
MKHLLSVFTLLLGFGLLRSQNSLQGQVVDRKGQPLFAANVFVLRNPALGTISAADGSFRLRNPDIQNGDSVKILLAGYQAVILPVQTWPADTMLRIQLKAQGLNLAEVQIRARSPIADQFSVVRMKKLDIYLNPIAAADPLRAITSLPASTNTDESANPDLRGSSASRNRVILNGVPVYQPVRNSQLNGLGNFSLFNTELLEEQLVYASNPPLSFGNASGGLVQLNTVKSVDASAWQFSAGVANLGIFRTQKLPKGAFFQAYSNFQFPDLFLGLHQQSLGFLKDFGNLDGGLHLGVPLGKHKRWFFRSISYGIRERYAAQTQLFTYQGLAQARKNRQFHLGSLQYQASSMVLYLRGGWDQSRETYQFGNIRSHRNTRQLYGSVEAKGFVGRKWVWQAGINYDGYRRSFQDTSARYYYALAETAPTVPIDTVVSRPIVETHAYLKHDPNERSHLAVGLRTNFPQGNQAQFVSFQASWRQDLPDNQSILLSAGRYHSYSLPGFFFRGSELLRADQISLDYQLNATRLDLTAALFAKDESGMQSNGELQINRSRIFGIETYARYLLSPFLSMSVANTYLLNRIAFSPDGTYFRGNKDFPFFLKASLAYDHPKQVNVNISWIGRPGTLFNPVLAGRFQPALDVFEPIFDESVYTERLGNYHNISLGVSRYIDLKTGSLIVFLNVNNLLDRFNPSQVIYNRDYSERQFSAFSRRIFYGGLVWRLGQS